MNRTAVAAIAEASNDYTASFDNQNNMLDGARKKSDAGVRFVVGRRS